MSKLEMYDTLEMEAALCVWEWICEVTIDLPENKMKLDDWIDLRSNTGSIELRHASMPLGKWCLQVFEICRADDEDIFHGHSYDFDVIPAIMSFARDMEGQPCYTISELPDPRMVAPKVLKSLGIHMTEHRPGYWKETSEGGLSFFVERPANPDFFPNFGAVSLKLDQSDLLALRGLMMLAFNVRSTTQDPVFEARFSGNLAHRIEVLHDGTDGFYAKYCEIRVISSAAETSARFEAINKHSEDRIVSEEFSLDKVNALIKELKNQHWFEDESYPAEDWRAEVAIDATRLGYADWVSQQNYT